MQIQSINLGRLQAHPSNSNVMADDLLDKLAAHLERTDRYPPLIVRPMPGQADHAYQILDGHHRVKALEKLGRSEARCVVWEVDDHEALLLLATLNRLQGKDDVRRRASLIAELNRQSGVEKLATLLPEGVESLGKLLALHEPPPKPRPPMPLEEIPMAVHFFLLPAQRKLLDRCLKSLGGTREEALMLLVGRVPLESP